MQHPESKERRPPRAGTRTTCTWLLPVALVVLAGCNVAASGRGLSFSGLLGGGAGAPSPSPAKVAGPAGSEPSGPVEGGATGGSATPAGPLFLAPSPPPVALSPGALGLSALGRYVVAPGMMLEVRGQALGAKENKPLQVLFGAKLATSIQRESDTVLRVQVPDGVTSGDLALLVGGVQTNSLPYRVLRDLRMTGAEELLVGNRTVYRVQGTDTENRLIDDPPVDWEVSGAGLSQAWGQATAVSPEDGVMRATLGNLIAVREVHTFRVDGILLDPAALDLVASDGTGTAPDAGFVTERQVTAQVLASDDQTRKRAVTWAVGDEAVAAVAPESPVAGLLPRARVSARNLAAERNTVLRVVSVDDPRIVATLSVRVRPESGLGVVVE